MDFPPKRTLTKRGIKKIDALVTGFILGGVVASIYGIKKHEGVQERIKEAILRESDRHTLSSILKMLVFGPEKPKRPTVSERVSHFFESWPKK